MENLNLPLLTKEVIIGLILGDASLVRKYLNGNAYFKCAQSTKHTEYLNFVFSILEPYCNMTSPTLGQAKGYPGHTEGGLWGNAASPNGLDLRTLFGLGPAEGNLYESYIRGGSREPQQYTKM